MTQAAPTEIYFDFLCPYAWRGLELADVLRRDHGFLFTLRHFSLVQGNHPDNVASRHMPVWWLSEQPGEDEDMTGASLTAFLADSAAAKQGEEARWRFSLALLRARHRDAAVLDTATVQAAAKQAGLNLDGFAADLADDTARREALHSDLAAAAELGVFGTPTFALPAGHTAYFRFANLVPPEKVLETWQLYAAVLESDARIETVKRAKRA